MSKANHESKYKTGKKTNTTHGYHDVQKAIIKMVTD